MPKRLVTVLIITLAASAGAVAHMGATGVVKQRMDAMKEMGRAVKALRDMARGRAPYEPAQVKALASRIAVHAAEIEHLFPKGSLGEPSEAMPGIWKEWAAFKRHAATLKRDAAALGKTSAPAETMAAVKRLGHSCRGCHEDFRRPKSR